MLTVDLFAVLRSRSSRLAGAWFLGLALTWAGPAPSQTPPEGERPQSPAPAPAPENPSLQVPRALSRIDIDGRLDEPAWQDALQVQLAYQLEPKPNSPSPVKTTIYLAYDEDNLYAAFRAEDPDPKAIRARLTDRDAAFDDDYVGIGLDTFNDERSGFLFFVNPLGVQMDSFRTEIGGVEEDTAWDAIWDSAGRIDEAGYTVELAIPFTSLRFQRAGGDQTWGILPYRNYPRSERFELIPLTVDPDNKCRFCQVLKVTGFAGATPGRNLELTPTLTALRTEARAASGRLEEQDSKIDPGFTARWGITPNLTLSGTLNPDFSQVEADVAQLDINTQFALFFPEKRPFFLEGADYFDTPIDAVHTRTVADPSWGLKLTGKEGKNNIGLFVAEDDTTNLLLPFNQFSTSRTIDGDSLDAALRYRRDVGSRSTVGALFTSRDGEGYSNRVMGLDGVYRFSASDRIIVNWLDSRTDYPTLITDEFEDLQKGEFGGQAWRASYIHNSRHWRWYARADETDEGFRADLGFLPRVGTNFLLGGLERTWWGKGDDWYTRFTTGIDYDDTQDQRGGHVLERELEAWAEVFGPLQSFAWLDTGRRERFWNGRTFRERFTNFEFQIRPSGSLFFLVGGTFGDEIDFAHTRSGDELVLNSSVGLNLGEHLQFQLDHNYQDLDVQGGTLFVANLSQLRAIYQLNIRTFFRAILQYTDIENDTDLWENDEINAQENDLFTQLLFSYKLNPQTVLFLGYQDFALGNQDISLTRENRTLFFKVGYAWVL